MKKKIFNPVLIAFSLIYTYIAYLILDSINEKVLEYFNLNPFHSNNIEVINSYFFIAGLAISLIIKPLLNLLKNIQIWLLTTKQGHNVLDFISNKLNIRISIHSSPLLNRHNLQLLFLIFVTLLSSIFLGFYFKIPNPKLLTEAFVFESEERAELYLQMVKTQNDFFSLNKYNFNWPYSLAFLIIIYYLYYFIKPKVTKASAQK